MPIFGGAALFKELRGSFHRAYFKTEMVSVISKNEKKITQLCYLWS